MGVVLEPMSLSDALHFDHSHVFLLYLTRIHPLA